jgi:tRNA A-37 threonylcarbamoyl transferase component Bud32
MSVTNRMYGRFLVTYYSEPVPASKLVDKILKAPALLNEGRGGIRIVEVAGRKLVCRQYLHGGLFRSFTRALFFSASRSTREVEILLHLKERGFPVITPFATITESCTFAKRLYLVTVLEEQAVNLLEYLKRSDAQARMRAIKRFAELLWGLEEAGVYHPDLHLRNVVLTTEGEMLFLDFDKAAITSIDREDAESMLWRLARFVEKMERLGELKVDEREQLLFLRTYERLSRRSMIDDMQKKMKRKGFLHRIGWFIESLLYGRPERPNRT